MKIDDVVIGDDLIRDLRLSYSRVSDFDRNGPRALLERSKISGEFLDFGNLVDDMLQPSFVFSDKYYEYSGYKPTAMLGTLCDEILRLKNENKGLQLDDDFIINLIKDMGLWKTTKKDELLRAKFTPEALNYVKAMVESKGKTLITTALLMEAEEYIIALKTHIHTKEFLKLDLLYQVEVNFRYKNFMFKSFLDYIYVDHDNKTIRGIDLKSGSKPVDEFISNFIKYRYYQQGFLYQTALESYIDEHSELSDYELLPFQFLYCGRRQQLPVFLTMTDKWHEAARDGFVTNAGYEYKGVSELVDNIEWHWRNGVFNMSQELNDSNGVININDNIINI